MKLPLRCALLAVLTLPLSAQKMATPAGEAPGPWILGTIGVGKTADPKVPQTTALKGIAIKVGEHGEAAVAYDLDLCRMVGAWTEAAEGTREAGGWASRGKFTTPMNLMSRGEYPTALGEVAFTTGEIPGFLLGADALQSKSAALQRKEAVAPLAGDVPGSRKDVPPSQKDVLPPSGNVPPRAGNVPTPSGTVPISSGNVLLPSADVPAPSGNDPIRRNNVPPAQRNVPAAQRNVPAAQRNVPAASGNGPGELAQAAGTQSKVPAPQSNVAGWADPRPEPFGPLPPGQARFKGFYVNGDKTILKWDIGGTEVLEMPGLELRSGTEVFTRTFEIGPTSQDLYIAFMKAGERGRYDQQFLAGGSDEACVVADGDFLLKTAVHGIATTGTLWMKSAYGTMWLNLRKANYARRFKILTWRSPKLLTSESQERDDKARSSVWPIKPVEAISELTKGSPARWPETVTTAGEVSAKADEAYVVDTIKLPDPNPWGAPMFVGGFDFFPDGRAAVCTFHGDVFVVSGLSDSLEKVTWRRFASGLYHALGLKIVNGEIYVTCRDGLWRLKDLNGDGECDFYEAFNFDLKVTKSFHEFVFDLQTDPAGNFYYAKAGPVKNGGRGFDEIMAHHGALLRVSPDGAKLDVIATGFRAPNGIGCGPHGELTSGDNEGTWTPACKINWIVDGGFYGVVPLAHGFRAIKTEADLAIYKDITVLPYDLPLCWLPKRVDNSGGGQVWVPPGDKWGPWGGQLLHLSYGTCSLFGVLKERLPTPRSADKVIRGPNVMQGGVVRFPVNFQSGIMRARFSPTDGQLYVGGLRGWQTTGVKNGAFQRVRYTGAPVRMPIGLHATKRGVRLDFACALDPATANDPQNWNVEVWRYLWSSAYGSPEFSTTQPAERPFELDKNDVPQLAPEFTKEQAAQKKHDALTVKSATLSKDGKSVFLELPEIKPVMQMAIKFGIKTADGAELRSEVINTIHALSAE